jgi:hypothetical protein
MRRAAPVSATARIAFAIEYTIPGEEEHGEADGEDRLEGDLGPLDLGAGRAAVHSATP